MDIQLAIDSLNIEISNRDKVTDALRLAVRVLQNKFTPEFSQLNTYRKLADERAETINSLTEEKNALIKTLEDRQAVELPAEEVVG